MRKSERRYTVLFEPAEALPGPVTEGDTLESLHKDGLPIPEDIKLSADPVKEEVEVALPEKGVLGHR